MSYNNVPSINEVYRNIGKSLRLLFYMNGNEKEINDEPNYYQINGFDRSIILKHCVLKKVCIGFGS